VIERQIRAPGVVELDERKISVVALRVDAFVDAVADVTTGTMIEAGRPLVTLFSQDFASAAALYAADLKSGDRRAAGSRQRLENLGMPVEVIDRIAATGKPEVSIVLTAPRGGVVLERMAVEGMQSPAGAPLFRIADTSVVWVMADVSETDIALVKRGALAQISFVGLPTRTFTGTVDEVYPEVDRQTRTARLRIELPNPDGILMANMYASVRISSSGDGPVVQVPDSAVIDSGDRQVVIRDLGEGRFRSQPVTLGARGGGMVQIISGINEGDSIVTSATFLLDAESNLRAALAALTAPEVVQ
jgi:Cu(I)/Ag(I) efflux system membrane fusion protein